MKKNYILGVLAVSALAFVSCTKEQEIEITVEPKGIPFEFVAGTVDTKTVNAGLSTTWAADDQISLFHAVKDAEASTAVYDGAFTASEAGASVTFSGTLGAALDGETYYDWYAIYPYSDGVKTANAFDYVTIGSAAAGTQVQDGNDSKAHLAGVNYPLWAKKKNVAAATKPAIAMNQMASIIEVKVTNKTAVDTKVTKVQFSSTAESNLIGEFRVDLSGDAPAFTSSTTNSVATLDVTGADALAEDEYASFFFAVKPFTATAGSKLTITVTTDKGTQELSNIVPANFNFQWGKIHTLNFNFTNVSSSLAEFKYNNATWLGEQSISPLPDAGAGIELSESVQEVTPIQVQTLDIGTTTKLWNDGGNYEIRTYQKDKIVVKSTGSNLITKVIFTGSTSLSDVTADYGTFTAANKVWNGLAHEIDFAINEGASTVKINTINVFYRAATEADHILIVPVKAYDAAYGAEYTDVSIRKYNVSDIVVEQNDAAVAGVTFPDATTVRIPHSANASSSPRDLVFHVKSASAGADETVTVTQAGAPTLISSLEAGQTGISVTADVYALSKKGYIIKDGTGAIFVYTNAVPSVSIGDNVTVAGNVEAADRALRIVPSADATVNSTGGSPSYGAATSYGKTEIDAWTADASTRSAQYVTLSGIAKGTYELTVGWGGTANVQTYYKHDDVASFAKGDYVTISGYAYNVLGSPAELGIVATSVSVDATVPGLVYSDITGVPAAATEGDGVDYSLYYKNVSGWTPSIESKPEWVTSCTVAANCSKITYKVSKNTSTSSSRSGNIVVRLTKDATHYDYIIGITQEPDLPTATFTFSSMGYSNGDAVTSVTTDDNSNTDITLAFAKAGNASNAPKYYNTGTGVRMYPDNTLTISGATIKKVVITASGNSYTTQATVETGSISTSGAVETWTGSTTELVLTAVRSGSRIQTIVVTYQK